MPSASFAAKPASFFSSSGWKRRFSSRTTPEVPAAATAGPMQSSANATGDPSSSANRAATGFRLISGFGPPFGRPRWDASRMRPAPCAIAYLIVGSEARIRVSSLITPPLSGTLKSTRMKTRLPLRSTSLIVCVTALQSLGGHVDEQVDAAARVAPLVVVPRQHLREVAVHHLRVGGVDDRRVGVLLEVDRDERRVLDREDPLERARGGLAERVVDLVGGRRLVEQRREID